MKAILFDLDNTLYPEIEYVKSGFRCVSSYLNSKYDLDKEEIFFRLIDLFEKNGRGKIFDSLLKELGLYSNKNIHLLIYLYRSHFPKIKLYDDTIFVINALKKLDLQIGLITDGRASVQQNKVFALKLDSMFDIIIYTDKLGFENWKPSPLPFKIALDLLNSTPNEVIYVGDDPYKDFSGPKSIGMKTIQIKRNIKETYWKDKGFKKTNANFLVNDLEEIIGIIEGML